MRDWMIRRDGGLCEDWAATRAVTGLGPEILFSWPPLKARRLFRADQCDVTCNGRRPLGDVLIFALSLSLAFLHTPFFLPSCCAWRNSDALFCKTPTPARFVMVMKSSLASAPHCMICVIGLTEINSKSVHHIHLGRTFERDDKTNIVI